MGSISKYSHIGGLVLPQMNLAGWVGGDTIQYIVDADRVHETPGLETEDSLKAQQIAQASCSHHSSPGPIGLKWILTPSESVSQRRNLKPRVP